MKNNYDKYMNEVLEMKEAAYEDYAKSKKHSYVDYLKSEIKN